eukprot:360421-Rhodomonas_salina.1
MHGGSAGLFPEAVLLFAVASLPFMEAVLTFRGAGDHRRGCDRHRERRAGARGHYPGQPALSQYRAPRSMCCVSTGHRLGR